MFTQVSVATDGETSLITAFTVPMLTAALSLSLHMTRTRLSSVLVSHFLLDLQVEECRQRTVTGLDTGGPLHWPARGISEPNSDSELGSQSFKVGGCESVHFVRPPALGSLHATCTLALADCDDDSEGGEEGVEDHYARVSKRFHGPRETVHDSQIEAESE
uniref:MAPKK kinase Kpp4 n=1 Tax=Ganoderma boninense TaxID=34458 RepID=A0A5K1JXW1_9APHY|nr:MAPKK kinase Kpp4 [Ganoderma boninense]